MGEADSDDREREATELEVREQGDVDREARRGGGRRKEVERGGDGGDAGGGAEEGGQGGDEGGGGEGEGEQRDGAEGLRRVATFKPGQNKNAITRFWTRQVVLSVHHEDCRDHFGAWLSSPTPSLPQYSFLWIFFTFVSKVACRRSIPCMPQNPNAHTRALSVFSSLSLTIYPPSPPIQTQMY